MQCGQQRVVVGQPAAGLADQAQDAVDDDGADRRLGGLVVDESVGPVEVRTELRRVRPRPARRPRRTGAPSSTAAATAGKAASRRARATSVRVRLVCCAASQVPVEGASARVCRSRVSTSATRVSTRARSRSSSASSAVRVGQGLRAGQVGRRLRGSASTAAVRASTAVDGTRRCGASSRRPTSLSSNACSKPTPRRWSGTRASSVRCAG